MRITDPNSTNLCRWCGQPVRVIYLPSWVVQEYGRTSVWVHRPDSDPYCSKDKLHTAEPTVWKETG